MEATFFCFISLLLQYEYFCVRFSSIFISHYIIYKNYFPVVESIEYWNKHMEHFTKLLF